MIPFRRLRQWLAGALALVLVAGVSDVGDDTGDFLSVAVTDHATLSSADNEIKTYGRHDVESRARVPAQPRAKLDGWPPGPDGATPAGAPSVSPSGRPVSPSGPVAALRASFAPPPSARDPPAQALIA